MEQNLDVRAELYNPAQFEAETRSNMGIYDPVFNLGLDYSDITTPLTGSTGIRDERSRAIKSDFSIIQFIPSGGTATIGFSNNLNRGDSKTSTPREYWNSSFGISFDQPLLKNFGRENSNLKINVSRISKAAAFDTFRAVLMNTVAKVRTEYFNLYSLREQLEVRKSSLELARKILADTKERVAAGTLPSMEILNAEFGVTTREKELIDAEKAVRDAVDLLRLLLRLEGNIEPVTTNLPIRDIVETNEDQAIKLALERPDISARRRDLEISVLQSRVLHNNIKPDLSLVASASTAGLDHRFYGNLENIGSFDYPGWSVGLNFSYPIGNSVARNDYLKSRLKSEQTAFQIKSLEESATNDVKAAVRAVSSSYKQLDVADRGRAYAEERLKAFIKKNEVGLATTKDLLEVENDLATARNNQIIAAVNYDGAIAALWLATGEILEKSGVIFNEDNADKLYREVR